MEKRLDESELRSEKQDLLQENIAMRRELKDLRDDNESFLLSVSGAHRKNVLSLCV